MPSILADFFLFEQAVALFSLNHDRVSIDDIDAWLDSSLTAQLLDVGIPLDEDAGERVEIAVRSRGRYEPDVGSDAIDGDCHLLSGSTRNMEVGSEAS